MSWGGTYQLVTIRYESPVKSHKNTGLSYQFLQGFRIDFYMAFVSILTGLSYQLWQDFRMIFYRVFVSILQGFRIDFYWVFATLLQSYFNVRAVSMISSHILMTRLPYWDSYCTKNYVTKKFKSTKRDIQKTETYKLYSFSEFLFQWQQEITTAKKHIYIYRERKKIEGAKTPNNIERRVHNNFLDFKSTPFRNHCDIYECI